MWTHKRHFLTRNDVIWRILRKYPSTGVGCSLIEGPQKQTYESPQKYGKITYFGNRNPWTNRYKILHVGFRPGRNYACHFLWRSVKGFWCGEGSNFVLFHWLASSPLKHSRTTVRVCDVASAFATTFSRLQPYVTASTSAVMPDQGNQFVIRYRTPQIWLPVSMSPHWRKFGNTKRRIQQLHHSQWQLETRHWAIPLLARPPHKLPILCRVGR